jgi:integrase
MSEYFTPAQVAAMFPRADGRPMSERTLREQARKHRCCAVVGKAMFFTRSDIETLVSVWHGSSSTSRGKTWWVSGTINRVRVRESTGHTNKAEAQSWATRREFELDREAIYGADAVFTFGAALAMYLDGGGEQRFLLPLLDEWERKLMKDIHPGDVVDLANRLYPKASGATKNRQVITPVLAIFRHAAERGKCSPIVVERFETKRIVKRRTATWEWVEQFTAVAKTQAFGASSLFLASTGARIGDALALEWADVDLEEGTALLRDTKNGEDRLVELLPDSAGGLAGPAPPCRSRKRVFSFYDRSDVLRQVKTACKKAGLSTSRPTASAGGCSPRA